MLIFDKNKPHYVYIKDIEVSMFNNSKNRSKKYFCRHCLHLFRGRNVVTGCKNVCLKIIGKQAVKLENCFTEFKNYSKQIPIPFKFFTEFECILKIIKSNEKN